MNFDFSDEQKELRSHIRRILTDYEVPGIARKVAEGSRQSSESLWQEVANLGFCGIALDETYGGSGGSSLELCVLAEELGRVVAPIPYASSIYIAAEALHLFGSEDQKAAYLPGLAAGQRIGALALTEGGAHPDMHLGTIEDGGRLSGVIWPVADGMGADFTIVLAQSSNGPSLFLVDLDVGVLRTPLSTIDPSRDVAKLEFADARAMSLGAPGEGREMIQTLFDRAAVPFAFEQLGGAERSFQMARDYALDRQAFGRPIGSFQALKHRLVDMYVAVTLARANCYYAAWALSEFGRDLKRAAAMARISATHAYQLCARENIQIHGGMGFTWEFDCHLHYRRANFLSVVIGNSAYWEDRLVNATTSQESN